MGMGYYQEDGSGVSHTGLRHIHSLSIHTSIPQQCDIQVRKRDLAEFEELERLSQRLMIQCFVTLTEKSSLLPSYTTPTHSPLSTLDRWCRGNQSRINIALACRPTCLASVWLCWMIGLCFEQCTSIKLSLYLGSNQGRRKKKVSTPGYHLAINLSFKT